MESENSYLFSVISGGQVESNKHQMLHVQAKVTVDNDVYFVKFLHHTCRDKILCFCGKEHKGRKRKFHIFVLRNKKNKSFYKADDLVYNDMLNNIEHEWNTDEKEFKKIIGDIFINTIVGLKRS